MEKEQNIFLVLNNNLVILLVLFKREQLLAFESKSIKARNVLLTFKVINLVIGLNEEVGQISWSDWSDLHLRLWCNDRASKEFLMA